MTDTVIVSGGNIRKDFALGFLEKKQRESEKKLCIIAADRGLEFLAEAGIRPDMVVGDFDSLGEAGRQYLDKIPPEAVRRLKPEKDDSDTQSAVNLAIENGAREIVLLGATTGNRVDHLMANLGLLVLGREKGVNIALADSHNYVALAQSGMELSRRDQFGTYISFFPLGGDVPGLTLEGFKYPLDRHYLTVGDSGLTVSNEMVEETCRVTFDQGTLLMIMSRD